MTETRHGLCGICPAGCFVTATLEDGRLVKVEPQEGNPLGMICQIGRHSPEIVHDPDRLLYPLRQIGPRGSHDFERISWDQAFESIVERLQETKRDFGPEATAIYTGRGSFDMALCDIFQPAGVAVSSASSVLFGALMHVGAILNKMGALNRNQAITKAIANKLIRVMDDGHAEYKSAKIHAVRGAPRFKSLGH